MNICVVVFVKVSNRVDNRTRFLRTRSAVEIDQLVAAYLLTQDREILAQSIPVDSGAGAFVHTVMCYTRCDTPLYSENR